MSPRLAKAWIAPILVFALSAVPFLPALQNGFVEWDDGQIFTRNAAYRGLGLSELRWMWTTFHMGHYQPLTWMTSGLDYALWGLNPLGYHLGNVVLHGLNAVLVYAIAKRLFDSAGDTDAARSGRSWLWAGAAALLFSAHPLRVESVAWATERRDVLSGFFFLLAIFLYLRRHQRGARWLVSGGVVAVFACALLSKAITVTLPAVLLILDVFPLRRLGGERGWWNPEARLVYAEKLPLMVLAAGSALLAPHALGDVRQLSLVGKAAVSAYSFGFYLWKTVAPTNLAPLYEMPVRVNALEWRFILGYTSLVVAVAVAWGARRRMPAVTAALLAYFVMVLPVLGLVQNGPQIAADRYTYLPGIALALLAAAALRLLDTRVRMVPAVALGVAALAVLCALTWRQVRIWRDTTTLWARVIAVDESSPTGHLNAGLDRLRSNDLEAAIREFARSAALKPANANAEVSWGLALAKRGDHPAAIEHYRRALEYEPTAVEALVNWGVARERQGHIDEAIQLYARAVSAAEIVRVTSRMLPDAESDAHANWGLALARLGRFDEAMERLRTALRIQPLNPNAENNLGVVLAQVGQPLEAAEHYRRALELDSTNTEARVNLGNALVREERFLDAIEQYRRAARGPARADLSYNWGVALALLNRLEEASDKFSEALSLDPGHVEAEESLGRALVMLGRTREGQEHLRRARSKRAGKPGAK